MAASVTSRVVALRCLQVFVGCILVTTGIGKLLDVPGFVLVIRNYKVFPEFLEPIVAVAMILIELRLAEWILRGKGVADRSLALAGLASAGLHAVFTAWAVTALLRGLDIPNCGCFGVFYARPLSWTTVVEDLVMVAVSAGIWQLAQHDS